MSKKSRVAIIGAGVSGLAAAVALKERGDVDLTVFEARREPGGRTRSYIDPVTGDELDNGQHLLASCYTSTLEYLRLIGTLDRLRPSRTLSVEYWNQGVRSSLKLPPLRSPADLAVGLLATDLLTPREKIAAMRLGNAVRRGRTASEAMTVAEMMRVYDQSPSVVTKLWEPIVLATMNISVERGSAQVFCNVLTELFFGERRGSALLFPSVGLSELLVRPAVSRIGPECMRFSEPVRELAPGADGVRVATDSGDERYDFAIVTEPSLMGHGPSEYSPIVNAYFWLDRAVLAAPIAGFLGTTLQWAFPKPSSWASQLLALTVSAADALVSLPNEEIVARLWSDLQSSLPAARNATLRHSQIIKEKRATPVISPATQACRPEAKTSSERVFLAGDYVQNGLPSTIEGAVRNGFRAAQLLRQALDGGVGISHPS